MKEPVLHPHFKANGRLCEPTHNSLNKMWSKSNQLLNPLTILTFLLLSLTTPNTAYNILHFGAKPDGRGDSSQAFRRAWAWACGSTKRVTLNVPKGRYVVRPTYFNGPCRNRVSISIKGTIIPPADDNVLAQSRSWIVFYNINGLTLKGGTFDAAGAHYWSCRRHQPYCGVGAQSISFIGCSNLVVNGLTSKNSLKSHMAIKGGTNIVVKGLRIRAPSGSPNTDGINLQSASGVTISNSVIKTGDDCIALGTGAKNIMIKQIHCGPGHGISIGSLGNSLHEEGVENITVTGAVFYKTQNGVRIKSWARESDGFVNGVEFRNMVMNNVYNPIIIDQQYCPSNRCPRQASGVRVNNIKYTNVKGTSATKLALLFNCSPSNPCRGISLSNIHLTFKRKSAASSCANAHGTHRGKVIPRSCL